MKRLILIGLTICILVSVGIYTVNPQVSGSKTLREIYQDVYDKANGRLMTTANVGAQGANAGLTEQEIMQAVYDADNHYIRTSSVGGGEGTNAWADLTTGTSLGDAFVIGTGSSLLPAGTGIIEATIAQAAKATLEGCSLPQYAHNWDNQAWKMTCAQVQFNQLGGAATDAQIPHLNTLSTNLTVGRCVQTNASTGLLESAAAACGTGEGGGAATWGTITGTLSAQTDLQAALDAKQASLGFTAVPTTRTVCGDPLSSNVTCTKSDVSLGNVDDKSSSTLHSEVRTETNALNIPRTFAQSDVSPIVINPLYQRITIAELSQATTFGVPTGTAPVDGQILEIDAFSTVARAVTFLTDANGFCVDYDISLPATTIAGKKVKWAFEWWATESCWAFFGTTQTAAAGGAAPSDAPFWTSTSNGGLSAEANMGALTTGLVCHTVTGGVSVPSTCISGADYQPPVAGVTEGAQLLREGGDFSTFTAKATAVGADVLLIEDSAASGAKKSLLVEDLPFKPLGTIGGTGTINLFVGSPMLPTSGAALVSGAGNYYKLVFDDVTEWCAWWQIDVPTDYASGLRFEGMYAPVGSTTGTLNFDVSVMASKAGVSFETDSYDTANNCDDAAIPTTANFLERIGCDLTNNDTVVAEDAARVKVCRKTADDNAATQIHLVTAVIQYTRQ